MRHPLLSLGTAIFGLLAGALPALAQAGGPELSTDDPYFPGEGALSTTPRVLAFANSVPRGTLGASTDRDKLIRLFLWRAEHFGHQVSPAIYNLPSVTPSPSSDNPLMIDYDAMRALFSYGWGVCGTNHAQMRVFADEAGWPSRRRDLQGDTGFEIQVDPGTPAGATGWRYTNTDQYTLHFLANDPTAHFASLDQVVTTNHHYIEWNPDLGLGYRLPQANTHGNYQDFAGVSGTVADRSLQWRDYYQGIWQVTSDMNAPLYGEGYTATPVLVHLKRGETFTRWADPAGAPADLGLAGRLWWGYDGGNQGGGDNSPFTQWSFVQNAPARDQVGPVGANPEASSLVGQRYGNGCFQWTPDLGQSEHLDGTLEITGSLTAGGTPALKSSGASTLVLFHNSPYTIAGRPSDGKDPAASSSSDGAVLGADTVGAVAVEVSTNAGATWTGIGSLSGAGVKIDFTDSVKGRNQYLLRLSFADGQGLAALSLRTVTMMNQAVYPNLKSGTAQISYSSANTGALELSPDLWSAASASSATGYVRKVADSGNVSGIYYVGDTFGYAATDNNPLSVTYQITIPPELASAGATFRQVFAAANAAVRVTPDGGPYTRIEISPNQTSWTRIGEYDPPVDDQLSAYWAYGRSADGSSLGGTTLYVRYTTSNGPHQAKLRYLRLSATYTAPASAAPVQVTYAWNNGSPQSFLHTVAGGATTDTWTITTGANVVQGKVVLAIPSGAAVAVAPTITTSPSNQTVTAGQTATLSIVASGTAPLTYQWQKNGTPIAGATGPSYTTPPTTLADTNASFKVTVTNSAGSVTSSAAVLTVNPPTGGGPTSITLQQGLNGYAGTVDTYIDQFQPTTSFGTLDRVEVRYYDPGTGLQEHMISLLEFDLTSIPSTATVTGATLRLYNLRAAANTAGKVVNLDQITSVWNDAWTWSMGIPSTVPTGVTCPSVVGYSLAPATPELYTITGLGALVQGWVTTPGSNHGLMLSTTTNLNMRFASSEYAGAQYRPALDITYDASGGSTPPTVTLNSPPSTTTSSPLVVTGSASGSSAITQVTWSNAATGGSGTATGTSSWSATIPLATGPNTITITATDSSGTSNTSTFTVNDTGPGVGAPAAAASGGGGGSHKFCGIGAAGEAPPSLLVRALALSALLLGITRQGPKKA